MQFFSLTVSAERNRNTNEQRQQIVREREKKLDIDMNASIHYSFVLMALAETVRQSEQTHNTQRRKKNVRKK